MSKQEEDCPVSNELCIARMANLDTKIAWLEKYMKVLILSVLGTAVMAVVNLAVQLALR